VRGMFDPLESQNYNCGIFIRPENDSTLAVDPLADLLLSVAAIIIIALIVILPTIPRHPISAGSSTGSIHGLPQNSSFRLDGRKVGPWVATEQGLATGTSPQDVIPVGRILLDEDLVNKLKRMRDAGETLVLFIDPKGLETSFQFEVIANRYGPKRILQVRLDSDCHHAKSERLARYCPGGRTLGGSAVK
jgi:hypothetical protein